LVGVVGGAGERGRFRRQFGAILIQVYGCLSKELPLEAHKTNATNKKI